MRMGRVRWRPVPPQLALTLRVAGDPTIVPETRAAVVAALARLLLEAALAAEKRRETDDTP